MQKKKENFRPLRSVTTFALAAAIITGSVYTVAAAVNLNADTKQVATSDGVELANGDIVYAGLDETGFTHGMIKAVEISVDYNGDVQTVSLAKGTVADVLERTGITPAYDEVVEPSLSTPIAENMTVKVYKGKKLTITADGKSDTVYAPNGNVCDILNQLGYNLSDDDKYSLVPLISAIDSLPLKERIREIDHDKYRLEDIYLDDYMGINCYHLRFMRLDEANIPNMSYDDRESAPLELNDGEYLGTPLHILYDIDNEIFMIQQSRTTMSIGKLNRYLSQMAISLNLFDGGSFIEFRPIISISKIGHGAIYICKY